MQMVLSTIIRVVCMRVAEYWAQQQQRFDTHTNPRRPYCTVLKDVLDQKKKEEEAASREDSSSTPLVYTEKRERDRKWN